MTNLFENAINSLRMGIEDFQSNDSWRSISALRNFYSGTLLLGKSCLTTVAPEADAMSLLSSRFEPVPDGNGGVTYNPVGQNTVDLEELRRRFKRFRLSWPDGDIVSLQKIRNEFEHSYSSIEATTIKQVIAGCFPLIEGFFRILKKDPAEILKDSWQVMLQEEAFFACRKRECDESFYRLPWGQNLSHMRRVSCSKCGSTLIYQEDQMNSDPTSISGKCLACGEEYSAEATVRMIVEAEYGLDDYISFKDSGDSVILMCQECGEDAYVFDEGVNMCYYCGESITGRCGLCEESLTIFNRSVNNPSYCDYCENKIHKVMRE